MTRIQKLKDILTQPKDVDSNKPLQSYYLEDKLGDTFSYVDNLMNQFFQRYATTSRDSFDINETLDVLNHTFDAKMASKVSDLSIRRMIS